MKTPLCFIAALTAFFTLPLDFTMMVSVLFTAGLAAIVVADYRRSHRPARFSSAPVASAQRNHLRLAA
jgi:hypothetical protein